METIIPLAEIGHRHTTGQGSSWPFAAIEVILATSNGRYPRTLPGSLTSEVLAGEKLAAQGSQKGAIIGLGALSHRAYSKIQNGAA
jgi:hypothetical protein